MVKRRFDKKPKKNHPFRFFHFNKRDELSCLPKRGDANPMTYGKKPKEIICE